MLYFLIHGNITMPFKYRDYQNDFQSAVSQNFIF